MPFHIPLGQFFRDDQQIPITLWLGIAARARTKEHYSDEIFAKHCAQRFNGLPWNFKVFPVCQFLISQLEHRHKRFLRNLDGAEPLDPFLARLLLFEQLALARNVAAVTFCQHVFAERAICFIVLLLAAIVLLTARLFQHSRARVQHRLGRKVAMGFAIDFRHRNHS